MTAQTGRIKFQEKIQNIFKKEVLNTSQIIQIILHLPQEKIFQQEQITNS